MFSSKIGELAAVISINTAILEKHFSDNNLARISLDPECLPGYDNLPNDVNKARNLALDAIYELNVLLQGGHDYIANMVDQSNMLSSVQALLYSNTFGSAFPGSAGSITYSALASASNLPVQVFKRLMRHAMSLFIFRETPEGEVAHTPASAVLANDQDEHDALYMICDDSWRSASRLAAAVKKWPACSEATETAFNLTNDTDETFWSYTGPQGSAHRSRFVGLLRKFSNSPGFASKFLVDGFSWSTLPNEALVVDIGGSTGHFTQAIARAYPKIRFVVQDEADDALIEGKKNLPEKLHERFTFERQDFFHQQPVKGADVYLLRWVLHDWADKYAIEILRNLVPAVRQKPGARILIMDTILPPANVLPMRMERSVRSLDIVMWTLFNACERPVEDWYKIIIAADPGLLVKSITTPEGSKLSLIEVVWESEIVLKAS